MSINGVRNFVHEWDILRLKSVVELRTERISGNSTDEGYVGLENIEPWTGKLLLTDLAVATLEDDNEKKNIVGVFHEGDILFGKLRPYLAKAHFAKASGICSTELLVMTPNKDIYPQFLLRVILTHEFIDRVNAETFGVKMPRADWDTVANLNIPVPPLATQRAIASYLDRETAKIDAMIDAKGRLLGLLAEKRRALITHAVTRGLDPAAPMRDSGVPWIGAVPGHWEVPPVFARYEVVLGKMLDEKRISGTQLASYLRNADVQWHKINTTNLPQMDFDDIDKATYSLHKGDVLICEGGEVGRTAIWEGELAECYYQKALHRLRPVTPSDNPYFFAYVMESAVGVGVFAAEGNRSTIQHLTAEKLRVFRFPAPPYLEQSRITAYIDAESTAIDRLCHTTQKSIEILHERRAALIAAAVTGQIDVAG